ncbi:hypothetical protein [Paraburkholderia sp. BR14374]|uniref:hypothetical protein n=1 Tax=Paraburkholderia sp. BR14374 TaxID=3237007 RepID=UPI0034CED5E2
MATASMLACSIALPGDVPAALAGDPADTFAAATATPEPGDDDATIDIVVAVGSRCVAVVARGGRAVVADIDLHLHAAHDELARAGRRGAVVREERLA